MVAEADGLYADLAEPDRHWLTRAAGELRAKLRRTVEEVVSSGRLLAQARRRLGSKRWRPWPREEAQIPVRSATRLVAVGAACRLARSAAPFRSRGVGAAGAGVALYSFAPMPERHSTWPALSPSPSPPAPPS